MEHLITSHSYIYIHRQSTGVDDRAFDFKADPADQDQQAAASGESRLFTLGWEGVIVWRWPDDGDMPPPSLGPMVGGG